MQNNFGLADAPPLGSGSPRRNGNVEPLDVFDAGALIANKMMMTVEVGVEARGLPFCGHLADQAGAGQVAQNVVDRSAGHARIAAGQRFKDFIGGGVDGFANQVFEHVAALGRTAQSGALKVLIEVAALLHCFRLYLRSDFVKFNHKTFQGRIVLCRHLTWW